MASRQHRRPQTSAPGDGSRTIVLHDSQPREDGSNPDRSGESSNAGSLRLRGGPRSTQRVVWREDVVDNEGAGKKKSKSACEIHRCGTRRLTMSGIVCCIYHKPRQFDESSSDESDESDSDSDFGSHRGHNHPHTHRHEHGDAAHGSSGHGTASRDEDGANTIHGLESDSDEVNSYERMPRRKALKGKSVAPRDSTCAISYLCACPDLPYNSLMTVDVYSVSGLRRRTDSTIPRSCISSVQWTVSFSPSQPSVRSSSNFAQNYFAVRGPTCLVCASRQRTPLRSITSLWPHRRNPVVPVIHPPVPSRETYMWRSGCPLGR